VSITIGSCRTEQNKITGYRLSIAFLGYRETGLQGDRLQGMFVSYQIKGTVVFDICPHGHRTVHHGHQLFSVRMELEFQQIQTLFNKWQIIPVNVEQN
jgi:hypothetical protein